MLSALGWRRCGGACETRAESRDMLCCLTGPGAPPHVFEGLDKAVKIKRVSSAFLESPQQSGSSHSATPEGCASLGGAAVLSLLMLCSRRWHGQLVTSTAAASVSAGGTGMELYVNA